VYCSRAGANKVGIKQRGVLDGGTGSRAGPGAVSAVPRFCAGAGLERVCTDWFNSCYGPCFGTLVGMTLAQSRGDSLLCGRLACVVAAPSVQAMSEAACKCPWTTGVVRLRRVLPPFCG